MQIIYYRALNDLRQLLSSGNSFKKVKTILYLILVFGLLFSMSGLFSRMFSYFKLQIQGEASRLFDAFSLGMLAVSIVIILIIFMELLRELCFATDQSLLGLSPISIDQLVGYRLFFSSCRSLPWCIAWIIFPVTFARLFLDHWCLLAILFISVLLVWLAVFALFLAAAILYLAARSRISVHTLFVALYVTSMAVMSIVLYALINPDSWIYYVDKYPHQRIWLAVLPHGQLASILQAHYDERPFQVIGASILFYLTTSLTGAVFYFVTRKFLPPALDDAARLRAIDRPWLSRLSLVRRKSLAPRRRSWAIFQKDLKDLIRNPTYRNFLLALVPMLGIAIWTQFRAAPGPGTAVRKDSSIGLISMTLSLIQLVPLILSGRTIGLEHRMLDFYRLVLPDLGQLLDIKWRAHAIVNCLVALMAALPCFLLLRPGFRLLEVTVFVCAVLGMVPVFTMLAIAIGSYFPDFSAVLSVFGIRVKGIVIYALITLPIYSIVRELYIKILGNNLDLAFIGIAAAMVIFASALSLVLFVRARRKLSTDENSYQPSAISYQLWNQ